MTRDDPGRPPKRIPSSLGASFTGAVTVLTISALLIASPVATTGTATVHAATPAAAATGVTDPPPPAVLVLSSFRANLPFPRSLERGIDDALEREGRSRAAFYEYLDADRFPIAAHEDSLVRSLRDKYADRDVGAVIAWGDVALGLIDRNFEALAPHHVIATAVSAPAFERFRAHHADAVQLTFPQDYAGSLRVAMDVSRATRLVLVGENGAGARAQWERGVLAGWATIGDGRQLINLTDLPVAETLKRISTFPPDTAFFALPMFHDADGAPATATDMAATVTERASGPVFSHWDPFLDHGIVGGLLLSGERMGAAAARLAIATIAHDATAVERATRLSAYDLVFDGTVMAHWRIPESRLPPGSRLINRPPSLWNDYRWQVISALAALGLLAGISVALLRALSSRRQAMAALAGERGRLAERVRERTADLDRKAEELTRSNRELESFAYAVSHDLRAPLRAVRSYIQLLMRSAESKLDEDEREFAGQVRDGAGRLDAMIQGLLEYSRAGRREGEESHRLSLVAAIRETVTTMGIEIQFAGATVAIDAPDGLPALRANPVNLSRLLQNLIENALKYRHPDRAPVIAIAARWVGNELTMTVRDNGLGIPPGQEERIFGLFQRLPHGDAVPGHGVGLALCRRIVEGCGGRLWVESRPGDGSTFHAAFPIAVSATDQPTNRIGDDAEEVRETRLRKFGRTETEEGKSGPDTSEPPERGCPSPA